MPFCFAIFSPFFATLFSSDITPVPALARVPTASHPTHATFFLDGQVRQRDAKRATEKAEREIAELQEELRMRQLTKNAQNALAAELAAASGGKKR